MQLLHEMGARLSIAAELLGFLWRLKMWWIIPLVFVLLVAGLIIAFGSASGLGPFIYPLI